MASMCHGLRCDGGINPFAARAFWDTSELRPEDQGRGEMNWPKMETEGRLAAGRRRTDEELGVPVAGNLAYLKDGSGGGHLDQCDDGRRNGNGRRGVQDDAEGAMIRVAGDCMFVRHLCHGEEGQKGQTQHRHGRKSAGPGRAIVGRSCLECGEQTVLYVKDTQRYTDLDAFWRER